LATIKQVAHAAGVSVTTASYSLNGEGRISKETRKKVLDTAERIGYIPSLSARALKGQHARTVGIFVDGIGGPVYGNIIEGAQEKFKSEGWGLIVGTLNSPVQELTQSLVRDSLLAGSVILNGGLLPEETLLPLLKKAPMVVLDIHSDFLKKVPADSRLCRIGIDNAMGINAVFQEVLEHKCTTILFLDGHSNSWDFYSRKKVLFDLCKQQGLLSPDILSCDHSAHGAYCQVKDALSRNWNYDCVIAVNDEMAIGAMKALKESGLRIPRDIIVTGFDNIEASHWVDPSLTTINVDYKKLGKLIGETILELISTSKPICDNITFPVEFIRRQSTGLIGEVNE
jgi:LacI family transcriptional regulator